MIKINNIINKIKNKDKDLEGIWVAIDKYNNIICFDFDLENVRDAIGKYNWEIASRSKPVYYLDKLSIRKRLKEMI